MDGMLADLRFALRFLLRNRRSTAIAVLCLSLGIATTTSVFSGVSSWTLRPLPFPEPDQLVHVTERHRDQLGNRHGVSVPNFLDWRDAAQSFSELAAFERASFNISSGDEPYRVHAARITPNLFTIFQESPVLGRPFSEEEQLPGRGAVVILGHELFRERFGADPEILGKDLRIDGRSHTIVGVMRKGYAFPEWGEAWTPLSLVRDGESRADRRLQVIGRLAPGREIAQASTELAGIASVLETRHADTNAGWTTFVQSYRDELIPAAITRGLTIQLFASLFVLAIACANAANLLLALAAAREREIALRVALGATRLRIVRQLLTESTVIALLSGGIGAGLAPLLTQGMLGLAPIEPPYWVFMGTDWKVLAFALGASLATGLAFGLVPALRASRTTLVEALKEGGRSATKGVRESRAGRMLVGLELALSIVLLVGATLTIRSLLAMQDADLGIERQNILTWRATLSANRYDSPDERMHFVRETLRRVGEIPGVQAVGTSNFLPADESWASRSFEVEGQAVNYAERPNAAYLLATPGIMATMRPRLLHGRLLGDDDIDGARNVVVVSEGIATRFWSSESAIGRQLRLDRDGPWLRVVGVVGDVRSPFDSAGVGGPPPWQIWAPISREVPVTLSFALRSTGDPHALAAPVRAAIRQVDPGLPVYALLSMEEVIHKTTWVISMWGKMFSGLAVFALALASVGLYGLISYAVTQRAHELSVRMALGAQPADVVRLVMRQGITTMLAGAALGLLISLLLVRVLSTVLYGVDGADPVSFGVTTALLLSVALLATFLPARRATQVDPVVGLRGG